MKIFSATISFFFRFGSLAVLLSFSGISMVNGQCQWTEPMPLEWNEFHSGEKKKEYCRDGLFAHQYSMSLAISNSTVRLLDNIKGCDEAKPDYSFCQKMNSRKLMTDETVVVSATSGNLSCIQDSKGTSGWVPTASLTRLETTIPERKDWLGVWTQNSDTLNVSLGQYEELRVEGRGFWKGVRDNYNTGRFNYTGEAKSCTLNIGEDRQFRCRLVLRLLGDRLVVADNARCGGANVRFSGVYHRINPNSQD